MMFERKLVLYPVLLSGLVLLNACKHDDDEDTHDNNDGHHSGTELSACIDSAKQVTLSDERDICVSLTSFKANAPFAAGFMAPGKTTHTVFISDSNGNPINVSNDSTITAIKQYPMMFMESGHQHSAPYKSADTSVAEYGVYNFDIYYPMPSARMDGTIMGRWEYRVLIVDQGVADDDTDDMTHTVAFEPEVEMYMSGKVFRAVGKNENDTYKNPMDLTTARQYSVWMESLGDFEEGAADVTLYLTTQDLKYMDMAMSSITARETEHHESGTEHHAMGDTDSQTYPAIYAPMDMMGETMSVTLHDADNNEVEVSTVTVEVSTDDGVTWTSLSGGMDHHDLGYYSGSVPMSTGEVTMLVRVTVNDNIMTKTGVLDDGTDAEDIPSLKFSIAE